MKQIASICAATVIVFFSPECWKTEGKGNYLPPDATHFGLEASLRYFEDTLVESAVLLDKTHQLLDSIEISNPSNGSNPESPTCKLCGNYERLLAHIENLIEGRLYAVLPSTNWAASISSDLQRMYCFTSNIIHHLRLGTGFAEKELRGDDASCTDIDTNAPEWIDSHSKTRESLRLLEVSIEVFRFHIGLTREEMYELRT